MPSETKQIRTLLGEIVEFLKELDAGVVVVTHDRDFSGGSARQLGFKVDASVDAIADGLGAQASLGHDLNKNRTADTDIAGVFLHKLNPEQAVELLQAATAYAAIGSARMSRQEFHALVEGNWDAARLNVVRKDPE